MFGKGKGFALPSGDPRSAKLAIVLETPSNEDIGWQLQDPAPGVVDNPREEALRRQQLYPELDKTYLIKGLPAIGRSGSILNNWLLPKVGIRRSDVYVTTLLRCLPPRNKQMKPYPTGNERFIAERTCRQYDKIKEFNPTAIVITFAPHDLVKEITPLPLVIQDLTKAAHFIKAGHRVLLLMGGKCAELYLGWGSNVARSRGDYVVVSERYGDVEKWWERVLERASSRVKTKKARKAKVDAGVMDVLDVVAPKKRKKPGCKAELLSPHGFDGVIRICGETKDAHPTRYCLTFVSGRKKKAA